MPAERQDYENDEDYSQAVQGEKEEAAYWAAYEEERQRQADKGNRD